MYMYDTCILQETEQRTSDAQLRGQIESLQQQIEDYKVGIDFLLYRATSPQQSHFMGRYKN